MTLDDTLPDEPLEPDEPAEPDEPLEPDEPAEPDEPIAPDEPAPPELGELLADAARSLVLTELTEQAVPDPTPPDTPAQIAADLAALQLRLDALGIPSATASLTTKGLR